MPNTTSALPTSNTNCHPPADAAQFTISLPSVVFINLTITIFTTMYRAHQHQDTTLLAFLAFVYASYFILHNSVQVYSRLPRGEKSTKKELLRFTLWFLPTAVLLGFAVEFGTFMNVTLVLLMYCLAIASSSLLLYVHYIHDDQRFAVGFGTFMNVTVVVLLYCLAIASSSFLLYVHYIHDDQKKSDKKQHDHEHVPIAQNIV